MKPALVALFLAAWWPAGALAQSIEVVHFWKQPSERSALAVFETDFTDRGGAWYGTTLGNEIDLKGYAIDRISSGFAPTAVQWHGGPEIAQLLALDITAPLDAIIEDDADPALGHILPAVRAALSGKEGIGALPVGLHADNWAWRNLHIYDALGLRAPRNWADFLEQAPLIREAGYEPLAIGTAGWELTLLFTTVMLDMGGVPLYERLLQGVLDETSDIEALSAVFATFIKIRDDATDLGLKRESWSEATADVIEGRAAMQVMGDWAKGEFLAAGKKPGIDFGCGLAPGNKGVFSIVLDVFVLPKTSDADILEAQRALIDVVLTPENQKDFALVKGALPVVGDINLDGFDPCARLGMAGLTRAENTTPSLTLALSQDRIAPIMGAVQSIWDDPAITPEQAAALFIREAF